MSYLNGCFLLFSFLFFDLLVSCVGSKQVLVSLNFFDWLVEVLLLERLLHVVVLSLF